MQPFKRIANSWLNFTQGSKSGGIMETRRRRRRIKDRPPSRRLGEEDEKTACGVAGGPSCHRPVRSAITGAQHGRFLGCRLFVGQGRAPPTC